MFMMLGDATSLQAAVELGGTLPLFIELPRGLVFSEICSQRYSGKDREITSCVDPLKVVSSLAITGLV